MDIDNRPWWKRVWDRFFGPRITVTAERIVIPVEEARANAVKYADVATRRFPILDRTQKRVSDSVRIIDGTLVDEDGKPLTFGDGSPMCAFAPCPSCAGGSYCRVHGKPEHPHWPREGKWPG